MSTRQKIFLVLLAMVFIGGHASAQEKIDAPVWNVGDKWTLTFKDSYTVKSADEDTYTVLWENVSGTKESTTIYDRSNLNAIGIVEGGKRKEYQGSRRKFLDFPLYPGKTWKDRSVSRPARSGIGDPEHIYLHEFKVIGWEDVEVKAGKFKALKIEYRQQISGRDARGKAWYWYSPEVKNIVKMQYEKVRFWMSINDWEVISFELK